MCESRSARPGAAARPGTQRARPEAAQLAQGGALRRLASGGVAEPTASSHRGARSAAGAPPRRRRLGGPLSAVVGYRAARCAHARSTATAPPCAACAAAAQTTWSAARGRALRAVSRSGCAARAPGGQVEEGRGLFKQSLQRCERGASSGSAARVEGVMCMAHASLGILSCIRTPKRRAGELLLRLGSGCVCALGALRRAGK